MQPLQPWSNALPAPDGGCGETPVPDAAAAALLGWDWWLPEEREACERLALGIARADDSPDRAWFAQLLQEASAERRLYLWRQVVSGDDPGA